MLEELGIVELVASDMDGTLLDGDHALCESVAEAMRDLEAATDIRMYIATGRSRMSAMKKLQSRGFEWSGRPGVYLNGAVVYGPGGAVIYENTFPPEMVARIVSAFEHERDSVVVMPCSGDAIHAPLPECGISMHLHTEYGDPYPTFHDSYDGMLNGIRHVGIHMIGVLTKDCRETEQRALERVKALVSDFGPVEEFSVVLSISRCISVMPRKTSKGAGVLALCRYLSICPSRVVAVGDSGNDIEMIRSVGYGVAMANAKEEVKKYARMVVNRNDHIELPGIAQLLKHIVKCRSR